METGNGNWKWKLETETGKETENGNGNKRRTNHWFFIVCLLITLVFYLAIVMGLAV